MSNFHALLVIKLLNFILLLKGSTLFRNASIVNTALVSIEILSQKFLPLKLQSKLQRSKI